MSQGNPVGLGHQTTSGDNSSESGSHKKAGSSKSSLEVVELKLKKCTSEIEAMKKRQQSKSTLGLVVVGSCHFMSCHY